MRSLQSRNLYILLSMGMTDTLIGYLAVDER